jgi:TolA-binding protein
MKNILPWIVAVACAVGAGALYFSKSSADAQLAMARSQALQAETLQTQLDEAQKQVASQGEQITSMQQGNDELLKLRNQVRQLTDEKQQMTKQMQSLQSQADRSQAEIQQVQARTDERAKAMAEQQILQMKQNQSITMNCINNLRVLDGAKQQWALERGKTAADVPTPADIAVYLPGQQMPQCPGGGHYTLNAVGTAPTCSIPGHVLQ